MPPDGGGFALVNQERKSQAGVVAAARSRSRARSASSTRRPLTPEEFGANPDAENARYLYVLLHGIGVLTNAWSANTVAWLPSNARTPLDAEWLVSEAYAAGRASPSETDPTSRGVVQIGACYGAWTLDTIQAPSPQDRRQQPGAPLPQGRHAGLHRGHAPLVQHGDAAQRHAARPDRLRAAALARHRPTAWRPIDAFQAAKVGIAQAIDTLVAGGRHRLRQGQPQDPPLHGLPGAPL